MRLAAQSCKVQNRYSSSARNFPASGGSETRILPYIDSAIFFSGLPVLPYLYGRSHGRGKHGAALGTLFCARPIVAI